MVPNDPVMLLSYVNLKLRDYYQSLEDMCGDIDVSKEMVLEKLSSIDYHYGEEKNQFVRKG